MSRYRARLGRSPKGNRLEAVMSLDEPEAAIAAMSGDEIYGILRESDFREAGELMRWASPEQVQVVADFSLWSGDRPVPARMREWVEMMAELPYETVGGWIRHLDVELVALLIRKGARIYDLSMEEPPDESQGLFYPTPDRLFVLDIVGYRDAIRPGAETEANGDGNAEGDGGGDDTLQSAQALLQVIDQLYRDDQTLARKILVGAKSELDSELEEMAFRWRQGRMADHGFVDPFEALEVYQPLDPASVRLGEKKPGSRAQPVGTAEDGPTFWLAPSMLASELDSQSSLFVMALGRITDGRELDELHFSLVALANRVLSADRVDPADAAAAAAVIERLRGMLDIGVEFLARDGGGQLDTERAVEAVRTVPLVRLFRLGVSLVETVRALARTWLRKGPFATLVHLDLLEEPEATVFAAVGARRPRFPRLLDEPPAAGERPFASLGDVARATRLIQRAVAAQGLLLGLGVRPEHLGVEALEGCLPDDPLAIDAAMLGRTALVRQVLHRMAVRAPHEVAPPLTSGPAFGPLEIEEVGAFEALVSGASGSTTATAADERRLATEKRAGVIRLPAKPDVPAWAVLAAELLSQALSRAFSRDTPAGVTAEAAELLPRWVASLHPLEPTLRRRSSSSTAPSSARR